MIHREQKPHRDRYKVYARACCQLSSLRSRHFQNCSYDTAGSIGSSLSAQSTCLLNLVEAHSVGIALVEAVRVSEGLQGWNRGQDVTQTDSFPQQLESDERTCPPQHLHGTLLAAALQAHPVHLEQGGGRRE